MSPHFLNSRKDSTMQGIKRPRSGTDPQTQESPGQRSFRTMLQEPFESKRYGVRNSGASASSQPALGPHMFPGSTAYAAASAYQRENIYALEDQEGATSYTFTSDRELSNLHPTAFAQVHNPTRPDTAVTHGDVLVLASPSMNHGSAHASQGQSASATVFAQPVVTNAQTIVNQDGATFTIGEGATVHFEYGAKISQPVPQHVLDEVVRRITRSRDAEYDIFMNGTRGPCTPGTRVTILQKVVDWCNTRHKTLYWMSGMAGTGKTTLMYTISQMLNDANLLGASFFCSRYLADCKSIPLILPTIAFELARRYPAFAESLTSVLRNDPDVVRRQLGVQLRKLIVEPWNAKKAELPEHIVVVIDALDECDGYHGPFLQLLFDHVSVLPFKILIASRPEITVRNSMRGKDPSILSTFILHEVEADLVRADIIKFLKSQLSSRTEPDIIEAIADLSGSLFIYAATVAKLLITGRVNIRQCILALQSSATDDDGIKPTMMAPLDLLYWTVLKAVLDAAPFKYEAQRIRDMLHTIICAYEPLTRQELADLWVVGVEDINRWLDLLRSVIFVSDNHKHPIAAFHASFADFILDPSRSKEFACDSSLFNVTMAKQCITLMNTQLRPNPCKTVDFADNESISRDVISTHISPGLQYASTYLVDHWISSNPSTHEEILDLVRHFLTVHLLCWIECLSLMGKLGISVQSLDKILTRFAQDRGIFRLAYDALRMIQQFYDKVAESAMMVHTVFTWIPSRSPFRRSEIPIYKSNPQVLCGSPLDWTGPERVIHLRSLLTSIAISQDGHLMACGCKDKVVRIWDMRNQIGECVLEGHTKEVNSVALFKDGNRVVSGSDDETVYVWNIATHQAIFVLSTSSGVLAIAISTDEEHIASGHKDGLVHIWDARNGSRIRSLRGHSSRVRSITFVPNSHLLVSALDEQTARVWNSQTGVTGHGLQGHTAYVNCVACSPDGTKIITGSWDKTARVWGTSGTTLQIFRGHSVLVFCAAFLADEKRAVTGSSDGTLLIWEVDTGRTLHTFTGAGKVRSIGVFPDGQRIASCSGNQISIWSLRSLAVMEGAEREANDGVASEVEAEFMAFTSNGRRVLLLPSLRILDTKTLKQKAALGSRDREYWCGALSASGSKVAAATSDYEISLWELIGDSIFGNYCTLRGHCLTIDSVTFSHNERQLVSASLDNTARVWDAATGAQIHILNHPGSVYGASFSHSNTRIISSSQNNVHIWDAQSGQELHQFDINTPSVTFTPDDRHIIASHKKTTVILNTESHGHEYEYKGYLYWTTFEDGTSYALDDNGWVHRFIRFDDQPRKLVWIPSPYRPIDGNGREIVRKTGPLFTWSPHGVQLCLPRRDGLVTLLIPHDYLPTGSIWPSLA